MAHFAELSPSCVVLRVLVVPDREESRGAEFLSLDLGLGGAWVQTSYNGKIRGCFAEAGMFYDSDADLFIAPEADDPLMHDGGYIAAD
jgi:hypothetical protein